MFRCVVGVQGFTIARLILIPSGVKKQGEPLVDITLEDFYVKENNLVDWQWDSNQCNYIASGKPSWSVTLKGSDLESQKGKMCPF